MILELIQNRLIWVFIGVVLLAIGYRLIFGGRNRGLLQLQKEYHELVHSDKYKVKGRLH